jgi:3-oxoacyl-[acyl-carrier protein] reductase
MPTPSTHAFAEKVALISDGANPIGRAAAMQLALYGCYVIVGFSGVSEENERALSELKNLGTLANAVEADIATVAGAKKLISEVEKMFGRIDLLVNCLKFAPDSVFEEITEEDFDKTIDANLKSVFFITREALRLMKPRPKPKIVNVVSACDAEETQRNIAFVAVQRALIGLTESLARALPKNFRVNAVAVSEKSGQMENLDAELFRPKSGVSEDDVARTILYLLSSESIVLNGQILKAE